MRTTGTGRNWAGNVTYRAERLVVPGSLDELAEVITPMNGVLVLRITAIGDEEVLSRPLMLNGELMEEGECLFQLEGYVWEEVGPGGLVSRRLS